MTSKTYAVTGVASGIGAELAWILKEQGHTVVGFDRIDASNVVDRYICLTSAPMGQFRVI